MGHPNATKSACAPEEVTGDPIILLDATGLEEHGLSNGMKGWANSVATVDKDYVFFMPNDSKRCMLLQLTGWRLMRKLRLLALNLTKTQ